ncbi:MAG: guanylate kinase [Spirochaetales bacterium]|nr:guanylate kinase [Spirochaetales bacterium]
MDCIENKGKLIVISGPSGVGKSTLLHRLFREYPDNVCFSVSYTSRSPRIGENHGKDYYFTDNETFEHKIKNNDFLEWARVHGNYYGTGKSEVEEILHSGKHCILDIDVQGADSVRSSGIPAMFLFIAPENIETLRCRLEKRGTESEETIAKRLKNAVGELAQKDKYDHVIVNKDLDLAYKELQKYIFG